MSRVSSAPDRPEEGNLAVFIGRDLDRKPTDANAESTDWAKVDAWRRSLCGEQANTT